MIDYIIMAVQFWRSKVEFVRMRRENYAHVYVLKKMAAVLNRLIGLGAGLAITGAVINSTLYNGKKKIRDRVCKITVRSGCVYNNATVLWLHSLTSNFLICLLA